MCEMKISLTLLLSLLLLVGCEDKEAGGRIEQLEKKKEAMEECRGCGGDGNLRNPRRSVSWAFERHRRLLLDGRPDRELPLDDIEADFVTCEDCGGTGKRK